MKCLQADIGCWCCLGRAELAGAHLPSLTCRNGPGASQVGIQRALRRQKWVQAGSGGGRDWQWRLSHCSCQGVSAAGEFVGLRDKTELKGFVWRSSSDHCHKHKEQKCSHAANKHAETPDLIGDVPAYCREVGPEEL